MARLSLSLSLDVPLVFRLTSGLGLRISRFISPLSSLAFIAGQPAFTYEYDIRIYERLKAFSLGGVGLFVFVYSPLTFQLLARRKWKRAARAAASGRAEYALAEVRREQREHSERVPDALQERKVLPFADLQLERVATISIPRALLVPLFLFFC